MPTLRATLRLLGFLLLTFAAIPLQWVLLKADRRYARQLPVGYHRLVCRLLGVRVHCEGRLAREGGVLIVANHISWLDIPVLSTVAPLSFVAKSEVATWPFVGLLARLQRSVFVERARRMQVRETASEMMARLDAGDNVVLFAEGTSSDGNRVLSFMSSLFGAVLPGPGRLGQGGVRGSQGRGRERGGAGGTRVGRRAQALRSPESGDTGGTRRSSAVDASREGSGEVSVQSLALCYTRRAGLPLGRRGRSDIAWYGDMALAPHAWALLKGPALDAHIVIGPPVPLEQFADRKALARRTEQEVRANFTRLARCAGFDGPARPLPECTGHQNQNAGPSDEMLDAQNAAE